MELVRLQRTDGNAWYDCLSCVPLIIFAFVVSRVVGLWFPEAADTVFVLLLFPMAVFYLWIIGRLVQGRWFLEYDSEGLTYHVFLIRSYYHWTEVVRVYSKKSAAFIGGYNDKLVVETPDITLEFFLHDYGLTSKKETVQFIEGVIETWLQANPSASRVVQDHSDDEIDPEGIYDDEI